jgi:hypothetical protein
MTESSLCVNCRAPVSGPFCSACGAPQGAVLCTRCGGSIAASSRFCAQCGQRTGSAGANRPANAALLPLVLGGVALLALVATFIFKGRGNQSAESGGAPIAPAAQGAPPDLSQMSPRERFDRLYNRVMGASESGDTATVSQFMPMALSAYTMLDSVDADARYHASMLRLHTGDVDGAGALADTILAKDPGHLFGFVIQGTVARWGRNEAALDAAHRDFLAGYDREIARGRGEYRDHQIILDRFRAEARGEPPATP